MQGKEKSLLQRSLPLHAGLRDLFEKECSSQTWEIIKPNQGD
jgi:hypothetical protein